MGNHGGKGRFVVQGTADPNNPPFICGGSPNFVELRGGDYFFIPSLTALAMMASHTVDPRENNGRFRKSAGQAPGNWA